VDFVGPSEHERRGELAQSRFGVIEVSDQYYFNPQLSVWFHIDSGSATSAVTAPKGLGAGSTTV
jgi:hypothetical protein